MRYSTAALALLLVLTPARLASAQSYAIQGAENYFRLEWEAVNTRRGPAVTGYVYNRSGTTMDRVRLAVDTLDGAGQVIATTMGQVFGTVPSDNRAYFEVPVRTPGSYRVRVISFDPIGRGT